MGILARILGRERRSAGAVPVAASDPHLAEYLGFSRRGMSFASTDEAIAALGVAARSVSLIAEGLAALPLNVYALDPDGGRREARDHPLSDMLNISPDNRQTAFNFRESLIRDLLIGGNGFAEIRRDGRGRVTGLEFMPARMVGVEQLRTGAIRYRYSDPLGATRILLEDQTLHLRYASRDGVLGLGPLQWAHGVAGLAVSQALQAANRAETFGTPLLSFETDGAFEDDEKGVAAFNRLKRQLREKVRGLRDGDPILLEAGLKAKSLSESGRDGQAHEARLLGLADVARVFGVPPSAVGLGGTTSYGSLKEESQALVRDCFRPMASRLESGLNLGLLSTAGRRGYRIEHDLSDITRGDLQAQMESYRTGIDSSILSLEQARVWLGLPAKPRDGATGSDHDMNSNCGGWNQGLPRKCTGRFFGFPPVRGPVEGALKHRQPGATRRSPWTPEDDTDGVFSLLVRVCRSEGRNAERRPVWSRREGNLSAALSISAVGISAHSE